MPVLQRNRVFHIYPPRPPSIAGHFIRISIITIFQNIVDTHAPVAIIIIIRLPQISKSIHGNFIGVSKIITQYFKVASIKVAAKDHSLPVWLIIYIYGIPRFIFDHIAIAILNTVTLVSEIKIQLTIRAKSKSMDRMIMLNASNPFEKNFFFVGFIIS